MKSAVGINNETNRNQWIEKTLRKIPAGFRILDAGAGERKYKNMCLHLNYVSQDFGKYEGKGDGRGLQTGSWHQRGIDIICNITNIPEPDGSFDAIICTEVLEHLPDPIAAIREFSRLITHKGFLILTAPFCSLTHFAPFHFSTGFNKYFYETHMKLNGFNILELASNGNFFEYLGQEIRRFPSIANDYASVRISYFDHFLLKLVLKLIDRCSRNDHGSDEILCFGYHIFAQKIVAK